MTRRRVQVAVENGHVAGSCPRVGHVPGVEELKVQEAADKDTRLKAAMERLRYEL